MADDVSDDAALLREHLATFHNAIGVEIVDAINVVLERHEFGRGGVKFKDAFALGGCLANIISHVCADIEPVGSVEHEDLVLSVAAVGVEEHVLATNERVQGR